MGHMSQATGREQLLGLSQFGGMLVSQLSKPEVSQAAALSQAAVLLYLYLSCHMGRFHHHVTPVTRPTSHMRWCGPLKLKS